jgi:hypothetical protein
MSCAGFTFFINENSANSILSVARGCIYTRSDRAGQAEAT